MLLQRLAVTLLLAPIVSSPGSAGQHLPGRIETVEVPQVSLTPETLTKAIDCQSADAYRAFRLELSANTTAISWLDSDSAGESNGMLGMHAYRLATPMLLFRQTVDTVFFTDEGVYVSLPREKALKWVADDGMEPLPAKLTRQYFRFLDSQAGVVRMAFEPEGSALSAAIDARLGLPHGPSSPPDTLFMGCTYTRLSLSDFLKRAANADRRLNAQAEIFAHTARARSKAKR